MDETPQNLHLMNLCLKAQSFSTLSIGEKEDFLFFLGLEDSPTDLVQSGLKTAHVSDPSIPQGDDISPLSPVERW